jgi:hypothetical protein
VPSASPSVVPERAVVRRVVVAFPGICAGTSTPPEASVPAPLAGRACRDHAYCRWSSLSRPRRLSPVSVPPVESAPALPRMFRCPRRWCSGGVWRGGVIHRGVGCRRRAGGGAGPGWRRGCRGARGGTGSRAGWSTHGSSGRAGCRTSRGSWPGDAGGTAARGS